MGVFNPERFMATIPWFTTNAFEGVTREGTDLGG